MNEYYLLGYPFGGGQLAAVAKEMMHALTMVCAHSGIEFIPDNEH